MKFKHIAVLCALTTVAFSAHDVAKAQGTVGTIPVTSASAAKQWEYLVVTFGKTTFVDPISDPLQKLTGDSKLVAFSKAGIVEAEEATATQKQMDTLGRFGWELVGVVGEIGGDQEMLFKRNFDPSRSKIEAKMIAAEGKKLAADQLAAELLTSKQPTATELIDLDAQELQTATNAHRRDEETKLTNAIKTLTGYKIADMKVVSTADSPTTSSVNADVVIDATGDLLSKGNQYRSSQANALAKKVADAIYDAAGFGMHTETYRTSYLHEVKINVTVDLDLGGTNHEVGFAHVGGDWPK